MIGFDGRPWAAAMSPAITVIARPVYELGRQAVDKLLAQISDGKVSFPYSPGVLTAITLYALWSPAPASPSNVVAPPLVVPSLENYSWTKRMDNGTAKIYSRNVIGVGKIQFYLNGREIAWIRAEDEYDRKLRTANGFYYLVRTVYLSRGKNILEIYVNGQRVRRVAYANK